MQWHQLDHMQTICTSLQTTTPTPHHSIFVGRMLFLMPNQQCQSNEIKLVKMQSAVYQQSDLWRRDLEIHKDWSERSLSELRWMVDGVAV